MKYDDLLNISYKAHGRSLAGFDCYGLVIECCRRNGQELRDVFYEADHVAADKINDYISDGVNVQEIDTPEVGCIVEMNYNGRGHIGYMVERGLVIHTTARGVKTTPARLLKIKKFYKVVEND